MAFVMVGDTAGAVGTSSLPGVSLSKWGQERQPGPQLERSDGDAEQPSSIPGLLPWALPKAPGNNRAPGDPKKTFTSAL